MAPRTLRNNVGSVWDACAFSWNMLWNAIGLLFSYQEIGASFMPQGILFVIVLILFAWLETSQNIFSYVFAFFECCIKNCKLFKYPAMILYEKYIWLEETLFSPNSTGLMLLVAEGIAKRCERNKFTTIYCITKWKAFLNWFDHIMPRKQIQMIFFFW